VTPLRVGGQALAVAASHVGTAYRTVVSGADGLALTIGAVAPAGSAVASVTLNGHPVPYQLAETHRGLAVTVSVPHPAGQQTLAVMIK
jgi:hypothetical protein